MDKIDKKTQQDTERVILQAAEKEFMTKGYAGARTAAIAEAAGVSHALLHYYFRTKDKLFDSILSEKIEALKDVFVISSESMNAPLATVVRRIIDSHLDFLAANPDLPRFMIGEIYSNPERGRIFMEGIKKHAVKSIIALQNKINTERNNGRCRVVDARMLLLDIASLNVFSFMAAPVVDGVLGNLATDRKSFIAMRKKENFDTIMRKLSRNEED